MQPALDNYYHGVDYLVWEQATPTDLNYCTFWWVSQACPDCLLLKCMLTVTVVHGLTHVTGHVSQSVLGKFEGLAR